MQVWVLYMPCTAGLVDWFQAVLGKSQGCFCHSRKCLTAVVTCLVYCCAWCKARGVEGMVLPRVVTNILRGKPRICGGCASAASLGKSVSVWFGTSALQLLGASFWFFAPQMNMHTPAPNKLCCNQPEGDCLGINTSAPAGFH